MRTANLFSNPAVFFFVDIIGQAKELSVTDIWFGLYWKQNWRYVSSS